MSRTMNEAARALNNKKRETFRKKLWRKLGSMFGIGIITLAPFAATVGIVYWLFINIDNILQPLIVAIIGKRIPGVGFVITMVLILLVGVVARNVIGRSIIRYVEKVIPAMPVVRQLYSSIKQFMESFYRPKDADHMHPVFVEYPRKGMITLAFVTAEICHESGKKLYVLFIPTAPTPTGGFIEIVEESEIIRTRMSLEDALEMIISAGAVVPAHVADSLLSTLKQPDSSSRKV